MRKEYVIKSIDASLDGSPYVTVALASAKDMQEELRPEENPKVMGFSNLNDMMKDLNRAFANMNGGTAGSLTAVKLDMHEYKQMGIGVGDRVFLELTRAESSGV